MKQNHQYKEHSQWQQKQYANHNNCFNTTITSSTYRPTENNREWRTPLEGHQSHKLSPIQVHNSAHTWWLYQYFSNFTNCYWTNKQCCCVDCTDGQYQCLSGQCIPLCKYCDGIVDCYDQSDERSCSKSFGNVRILLFKIGRVKFNIPLDKFRDDAIKRKFMLL